VRAGLCGILSAAPDLAVVGEAATGHQAIALVDAEKPDVVLMDIRMPELDGIEATRRITATADTKVLILTTFDLDEYVYFALRGGASGFLLKDTPPRQLIDAVRTVAHGGALLAPAKTHVRHLLTKLDARDRVQLAIIAHRTGLTGPRTS
jgi:DNA-binding NarL/FixJ family response regulator